MLAFKSSNCFEGQPGMKTFAVECERERADFSDLYGATVEIDGNAYTVQAVERFMHYAPWRKGEIIGLLVKA